MWVNLHCLHAACAEGSVSGLCWVTVFTEGTLRLRESHCAMCAFRKARYPLIFLDVYHQLLQRLLPQIVEDRASVSADEL